MLEASPNERVAEAIQQLDFDEAVYLLEDLDKEDQSEILAKLPSFEREALERSLEYPRIPPAASCRRISSPCRLSGRSARPSTI